jgi:hypothetical protein
MTRIEQVSPVAEFPIARVLAILGAAAVVLLLAWAAVTGRNARAAADAIERAEIAQENKTLCTELGFEEADTRYVRCQNGLAQIRRKQTNRWNAAIQ